MSYPLTIRARSDTESNWKKYNPILKEKEFITSITSNGLKYKVGNGIDSYTLLPYLPLEDALSVGCIYATGLYNVIKIELVNPDSDN